MNQLHKAVFFICLSFLFFSCKKNNAQADAILRHARQLYASGKFTEAKKAIDSIQKTAPKAFDQINAGFALLDSVRYGENFQEITVSENRLKEIENQIKQQKTLFTFEFNPRYQNSGNYIPKIYPMAQTTGLYSGVNADGQFFMESVSTLTAKHHAVQVTAGGTSAETASVRDDGANYRFRAGAKTVEIVHYSANRTDGVAPFVIANQDKVIVTALRGSSSVTFNLSANAKKGIADSYEFAKLFEQRDSARFRIAKSKQLIKYLDSKRAKEIAARAANRLEGQK